AGHAGLQLTSSLYFSRIIREQLYRGYIGSEPGMPGSGDFLNSAIWASRPDEADRLSDRQATQGAARADLSATLARPLGLELAHRASETSGGGRKALLQLTPRQL